MKFLMIINGAAYGQDATYNALRLAKTLAQRDNASLRIFLMGDGVTAAIAGQKTPDGYYKLDRMLNDAARHGAQIGFHPSTQRRKPGQRDSNGIACSGPAMISSTSVLIPLEIPHKWRQNRSR